MTVKNNSQRQFLVAVHDAINLWEMSKRGEREKLEGLAQSILLLIDGKHKSYKYRLVDSDGVIVSGCLFETFEEANPYQHTWEISDFE